MTIVGLSRVRVLKRLDYLRSARLVERRRSRLIAKGWEVRRIAKEGTP